jgi:hypothetical protein
MDDAFLLSTVLSWLLTGAVWWGIASATLLAIMLLARERNPEPDGDEQSLLPPYSAEP